MRYDDSPGLFGCGVGTGTSGDVVCEWCGTVYDGREEKSDDPDCEDTYPIGESIEFTSFGGKQICECCFEKVEAAVLQRMPDILPWFKRILDSNREDLESMEEQLSEIAAAI